jgi:hypothetical protein
VAVKSKDQQASEFSSGSRRRLGRISKQNDPPVACCLSMARRAPRGPGAWIEGISRSVTWEESIRLVSWGLSPITQHDPQDGSAALDEDLAEAASKLKSSLEVK